MALSTQSFTTLVQNWAAAAQAKSATLIDLTTGTVLRAIAEATSGVALWLQGLILQVLATTRLATCQGVDVDTFVADFGLTRTPALPSSGPVIFSRTTPTNAAQIPVGSLVQTADGTQQFSVIGDATNSAYSSAIGAYFVNAGVQAVVVKVQAVVGGTGGNVSANTITVLQTGLNGIDTVSNGNAFTSGLDTETDAALKLRFVDYINSLSKGTDSAIAFAIKSVQANLQYTINENIDLNGTIDYGSITVVIDDGTGLAPQATVTSVGQVIESYRAAGVRVFVFPASALLATVQMGITTGPGYIHSVVAAQVQAAIQGYITGLGLANALSYTKLAAIAYGASPGVVEVLAGYSLNGLFADLVPSFSQTIKYNLVTVS